MAIYRREGRVDAPLDDVWAFFSNVDGLVAITPDWMRMRVERVIGPSGEPDPEVLERGSEVHLSVRPFGVGPRQSWISRITERERGDDEAMFRDVMLDGPFRTWEHIHRFRAEDGGTALIDRVEYELPVAPALSGAVRPAFGPMFAHRHRRTREELE